MTVVSPQEQAKSMRVAFAIADKPAASRVETPRASGQCSNFWFLRSEGSRDLIPIPGATEAQLAMFKPSADAETAIADASTEIGALAAAIVTRLKAEAPAELVQKVDVIILCTAGIDSPIGMSLAGKMKYILGAGQSFPFTIGQMDGCSAFEALRVARAFMHGPERARVVAVVMSECWWYPYIRSFGAYAQYGDGAAAMLLTADDASYDQDPTDTGIEILDVALSRYHAQQGPFDLQEQQWFLEDAWPQAVGEFLVGFLRKHALSPADVESIQSPCLDASFIDAVASASGLSLSPGTGGFVSSVDAALAFTSPANGVHAAGYALSWSVGLNGEMGVCLYRRVNHPQTSTQDPN